MRLCVLIEALLHHTLTYVNVVARYPAKLVPTRRFACVVFPAS